jgi:hypothetical protein
MMIYKVGSEIDLMKIIKVIDDKDRFMDLLLLGDEQVNMIQRYLYRGELFGLFDDDLRTVAVVTEEDEGVYEITFIIFIRSISDPTL